MKSMGAVILEGLPATGDQNMSLIWLIIAIIAICAIAIIVIALLVRSKNKKQDAQANTKVSAAKHSEKPEKK